MNQKRKEFFDLPITEYDDSLSGNEIRPLSLIPISGDDLISATDDDGVVWLRTSRGDKRMRASDF